MTGSEAFKYFTDSAAQNNPRGSYGLAMMYESGQGNKKDLAKAVENYQKAAQKGLARAQAALAIYYANGLGGLEKNQQEAVRWFNQAAKQGLPYAQMQLGLAYARGEGITKDIAKAKHWLTMAAKKGMPNAQSHLGYVYFVGEGAEKNLVEAYAWLSVAVENGVTAAKRDLQRVTKQLNKKQLAQAKKRAKQYISQYKMPTNNAAEQSS